MQVCVTVFTADECAAFRFRPGNYNRLIDAVKRGDLSAANTEQERAHSVCRLFEQGQKRYAADGLAVVKAVATLKGLPVGPVRAPLQRMSSDAMSKLNADLNDIRFFDWCD